MNKLIEKYLKSINDENVSSAAGMSFAIDDPYGFVKQKPLSRMIYPERGNKKQKKEILVDEDIIIHESSNPTRRVLIDFDGVIHNYNNGWQNGEVYGSPIDGVKEAIDQIKDIDKSIQIVIFTTRAAKNDEDNVNRLNNYEYNDQINKIEEFLDNHDIYYDDIVGEKLGALIYIDDNGYRFGGNWTKELPIISEIIKRRMGK